MTVLTPYCVSTSISIFLQFCVQYCIDVDAVVEINSIHSFIQDSDYVSGARTHYGNSMCPGRGYVTARKNCYKPIFPAPGKIGGSDCVLHIICPASVDVRVRKNYRK